MESLRAFVDYSGGEICSVTNTRKRPKITVDDNVEDDDEPGKLKLDLYTDNLKLNVMQPGPKTKYIYYNPFDH